VHGPSSMLSDMPRRMSGGIAIAALVKPTARTP
jgi:hypothetical protein